MHQYRGEIYFDYSCLNLTNSKFNNNETPKGIGIFIYDSQYYLDNITFNNNRNVIYAYFDDEALSIGKIYGNDKISQDELLPIEKEE